MNRSLRIRYGIILLVLMLGISGALSAVFILNYEKTTGDVLQFSEAVARRALEEQIEKRGRALVESAEKWARHAGYKEIASDCEIENEVSHQAHVRLGYHETLRLVHFRKSLENSA